ncbi:hypothetical protein HD806DRAFT_464825 [Xylariaceae sp. AK1471]|nr:hypothetical protein HD806DRAFT_464825 [Xylariaceae sp. AK1471]
MTEQVSGSSLPQTRDLGQQQQQDQEEPRHTHVHFRDVETSHHHDHQQHHHHIRSQRHQKLHDRDNDNSDVVVIVETISVLQLIDVTGSTIIQTIPHDPTTPVITGSQPESTDTSSSDTVKASSIDPPNDSSSGYSVSDGNGVSDLSSPSSSLIDPTVTPSGSSMPTSFPTLSYAPITSTPLSATPVFPSISSGLSNSTQTSLSSSALSNSTVSLHSFTSATDDDFTILGSSVTGSHSQSTSSAVSSGFSSLSSSVFTHSVSWTSTSESSSSVDYFTSTAKPDSSQANGANGIGSPTITAIGGGSVSTAGSGSGADSGNASAGTIAGSVVGAIGGLAFILLLAAALLRWKKRQTGVKLIQGSGNERGYGAVTTGGSGGPTGDGGMSERRRSIPFAIPAALANLSGHNRFSRSTVSSDGGERGFAKISGRKLPPVLQFGGDGYTDPRGTMMSDQSIDYRASHNFLGEAPLSRLAVGSPMLQETGIPVFHASPARTAVATRNPFSATDRDPFSDDHVLDSPPLPPDPVGRTHLAQDRSTRSHGSFSRFTEEL